jgi:hypothetical protein
MPRLSLPSPAIVVAGLALVLALAGSSVAAPIRAGASALVTGKQIKNGTLTGSDVRNGSLTARDFKAGALPAGPTGPTGASGLAGKDGAPGTNGAAGKDGAPGLVRAYAAINGIDHEFRAGTSHSGVVGVRNIGDGVHCIALAPGIDPATAVPSVTVDTPGNLPQGNDAESPHAMVDRAIACDADEIGVRTMILFFTNGVLDVDASIDLDFTILVP